MAAPYKYAGPTENSWTSRKVEIRRRVLGQLPVELPDARVLELFAGAGEMRTACYQDVQEWIGVDLDPLSVATVCGDACLAIRSGVLGDLGRFDVIDLDPFANPWRALWLVSQWRRGPRPFALFLTEGGVTGRARMNQSMHRFGWGWPMMEALGLAAHDHPVGLITAKRHRPRIVSKVLSSWFGESSVGQILIAGGGASGGTFYAGALITPPK